MKKYLLLFALVLGALHSFSQDFDEIKKTILLQKYDKAKPMLDSYLSVEKNASKPEGWYYKAYLYSALGRDTTKPMNESTSLYQGAFDAIKKYAELDPAAPLTVAESNATVYNTYYGFYDLGIKTYNNKNYEESYNEFKKALDVHDYIYNKNLSGYQGLKFSGHDTDIVWNLAVLANELKKKDETLNYYKKIADAGLGDEKYAGAYDELLQKYKKEKNTELFNKYLAAAKKFYPIDKAYWESMEIDYTTEGLENEALLNKYEELTTQLPDNYMVFYNYAIEIDRFINSADSKGKDINAYKKKIPELFKKAIAIKSTIEANLQMANLYYSNSYENQEMAGRIKGTKPEEVKRKNELNALSKQALSDAIPYGEEAVKQLAALKEYKFSDKTNYKLACEILSHAYKSAGNAAKASEYEAKRAAIDKM
ncbi:MAG TPA: hypothetical protein PK987_12305 [Ferruginibacter sp.]|nr:hypothetical protein [Ferruginibacter sp.]